MGGAKASSRFPQVGSNVFIGDEVISLGVGGKVANTLLEGKELF